MRAGEKAQPLAEVGEGGMVLPLDEAGTRQGMTTHDVDPAVTTVTGGSMEVFTSDCKRLLRSLSSCSRSLTQLCSLVSTASAF